MTLRELLVAAEAAREPHAALEAIIASRWRDVKKRKDPYSPAELNPFSPPDRRPPKAGDCIPLTRDNVAFLKVFLPAKPPKRRNVRGRT